MELGIRNFQKVNDWLYRGGQPTREQIEALAQNGVRTIVCLRWGPRTIAAERAAVLGCGMDFISIPLAYWRLPSDSEIHDFLKLVDNTAARPIFVHCFHGADRTGFLLSVYRMARENWTIRDAYLEMKRLGFHRFRLRHFKWALFRNAKRYSALWNPEGSAGAVELL